MYRQIIGAAVLCAFLASAAWAQPASQPVWGKATLWDGDTYSLLYKKENGGVTPAGNGNAMRISKTEAHGGVKCLEMHVETGGAANGNWNLFEWYPFNWGIDATWADNVSIWVKVTSDKKLESVKLSLGNSYPRKTSAQVELLTYCPDLMDGKWHEVIVPLAELQRGVKLNKTWEIFITARGEKDVPYSIFIDDVAFTGTRPDIAKEGTYWLQEGDTVLFLGDSITNEGSYYGTIFGIDLRARYPELVMNGDKLGEKNVGPKIKFINAGVSGEQSGGGLSRLPGLLEQYKPTACVVCYGMNDWRGDRAKYEKNMRAIVQKLKAANVAVTILSSPCVCTYNRPHLEPGVKAIAELTDQALQVAKDENVHFADCNKLTRSYQLTMLKEYPKSPTMADFGWNDGIHPNYMGYRCMADALEADWGYGLPLAKQGAPRPAPKYPEAPTSAPTSEPK